MRGESSGAARTVIIAVLLIGLVIFAASGYVQPIVKLVLTPVLSASDWVTTRYIALYEAITLPRDMAALRQENANLKAEVSSLQSQIIALHASQSELEVIASLLDYKRASPLNKYVVASVIGKDPSPFLNYVIINKGSDDGIRSDMPVITGEGLVGRIVSTTANAARVQLISDPGSILNVKFGAGNISGQVHGSVTGEITLERVSQTEPLNPGDIVLTSGLGGGLPDNIVVGQVLALKSNPTDLFQSAGLQPAVSFNNLQLVMVVTNFKPVDISPLLP
ncbi:MAG TPA: rod shape-determining protein MreC [Bellilinea sp.]|nr:rod shape-determining protein MreC [Bellilinea sp.]